MDGSGEDEDYFEDDDEYEDSFSRLILQVS